MNLIEIKINSDDAKVPTRATAGAAGYDLCALDEHLLVPQRPTLIKTGISMAIPDGFVGMVCSRSGLALKKGVFVLNAPGIIDSDYRGDVGVILFNALDTPMMIEKGDRIAQILFMPLSILPMVQVDELTETIRGTGGFGSTSIKSNPRQLQ